MTNQPDSNPASTPPAPAPLESEKVLVRGVHLDLTPALRAAAAKKSERLFRHHLRVMRVRIDLEHVHARDGSAEFVASGRVEVSGPDLIARVATDEMYKAVDLLVDKLDRMLRERTQERVHRRNDRPEGTEFRDKLADEPSSPPATKPAPKE